MFRKLRAALTKPPEELRLIFIMEHKVDCILFGSLRILIQFTRPEKPNSNHVRVEAH